MRGSQSLGACLVFQQLAWKTYFLIGSVLGISKSFI